MSSLFQPLTNFVTDLRIATLKKALLELEKADENALVDTIPYWSVGNGTINTITLQLADTVKLTSFIPPFTKGFSVLRARIILETIIHEGQVYLENQKKTSPLLTYAAAGVLGYVAYFVFFKKRK